MDMQFGLSAFERARGDLPQLPVENMFLEAAPTEKGQVVLQSRPGLEETASLGGNVQAIFRKDGVLGGNTFAIVDTRLYRDNILVGSVDGIGPFFMDGYANLLFIAGGHHLWGFDGSSLTAIAFPDDAYVLKVVVGASRAICLRAGTEKFYWSDPLTSTLDGLSFATAESQPDRLRDMLFIDDTLILFGAETVEFWPNTGDGDLPFQPLEGRVFERGVRETGAACAFDASFLWVGDDDVVYANGQKPTPISNEGLQEKVTASPTCSLWTFRLEGTEFAAMRLGASTYVYSARSQAWSNFASDGVGNWLCRCWAGGKFGTSDGRIAKFSTAHADFDGPLVRSFTAGTPLDSGAVIVSQLGLRVNPGQTPYLSGGYSDPIVETSLSRDGGQTFGSWKASKLGAQGKYRNRVQWAGLGGFGQPGVLAKFRTSDPVPFRVSGVLVNEPFGGL